MLRLSEVVGNTMLIGFRFSLLMYLFSSTEVSCLSFPSLPIVCFAPVRSVLPVVKSMSWTFSHVNSMGRSPKSGHF